MSRILTFIIADRAGRQAITTTSAAMTQALVDQGWTVLDIIAS